jgi:hypothetical protein
MKSCGMKVALLGTTLDLPDQFPNDPESVPEILKYRTLLEEEFYNYFDVKIKIINWEYVMTRSMAHRI